MRPDGYLLSGRSKRPGQDRVTEEHPSNAPRSPRRLSNEELDAIVSAVRELRSAIAAGEFFEAERIVQRPTLDPLNLSRLTTEVRRLRALVGDVLPYFERMEAEAGDSKRQRRIRQLQIRLRAELSRV